MAQKPKDTAGLSWSKLNDERKLAFVREMCEDHWRWQKNNPNGYTQQTRVGI